MGKILRILLLGVIGAAIVHILILFLVPVYSDQNAWSRLEASGDPYQFIPLSDAKGPVSDQDPLIREAACYFNLSDGPIQITAEGSVPFWSLSVYAPNGDNLYSFNDTISTTKQLNLIISDPIGMAALRAEGIANNNSTFALEQNIGEGAVILRAFLPDSSWKQAVDRFLSQAKCELYESQ